MFKTSQFDWNEDVLCSFIHALTQRIYTAPLLEIYWFVHPTQDENIAEILLHPWRSRGRSFHLDYVYNWNQSCRTGLLRETTYQISEWKANRFKWGVQKLESSFYNRKGFVIDMAWKVITLNVPKWHLNNAYKSIVKTEYVRDAYIVMSKGLS